MHNSKPQHGALEVDALAVDLSSPLKRRNAPTLMISTLVSARVIGAVSPGAEHYEAARLSLDHLERGSSREDGVFGLVEVIGLGAVALMLVTQVDAVVIAVLAPEEIVRWQAGDLVVRRTESLTAHELYGEPAVAEVAELDLGGGWRLFARGNDHVLTTTRTAAVLGETPQGAARALLTVQVERGLRACRLGAVDLCLGRLELPAAGRRVPLTLGCLPDEQHGASRMVRKVKRAIAAWGGTLQ